jgi:hypothetical protein
VIGGARVLRREILRIFLSAIASIRAAIASLLGISDARAHAGALERRIGVGTVLGFMAKKPALRRSSRIVADACASGGNRYGAVRSSGP